MTSIAIHQRPYTSPLVKKPTYPTILPGGIRERTWEQQQALRRYRQQWSSVSAALNRSWESGHEP